MSTSTAAVAPTPEGTVPGGTVVVGVDGSPASDLALVWAAEQASLEGRGLTIVHAAGLPGIELIDTAGIDEQQVIDSVMAEGQCTVDAAVAVVTSRWPRLPVHPVLDLLEPRPTLLGLAGAATMLVVGSRGHGPVASFFLGSVSTYLTRHARCPVVVLRPRSSGTGTGTATGGVLVGVDGHGGSSAALDFGYRQASIRGLPLTVVHCFSDGSGPTGVSGSIPWDTPGREAERLVVDESVAGLSERFPEVAVRLTLGRGPADVHLVDLAATMDTIVLGTRPDRSRLGAIKQRDVDRAVVTHAPCTVVVVPEPVATRERAGIA